MMKESKMSDLIPRMRGGVASVCVAACAIFVAEGNLLGETIAYWPFGTNGFHDVSGNGRDLVGVEIEESDDGYITFNGTNSYLRTASALDLSGEQQVTFECWARLLTLTNSIGIVLSSEAPKTAGGFVLYAQIGDPSYIHAQLRGNASDWCSVGGNGCKWFNDKGWHHIAYTIDRTRTDGSSVRYYLDGTVQNLGGGWMPSAFFNGLLLIGGGSTSYCAGDNFFAGYIDDVRVSRGILTTNEFLKYPSVGRNMRADSDELPVVAYWPFGGKGGADVTGNGFDLTMTGVPLVSGAPSPSFAKRAQQTAFWLPKNFPFSAFSRTGVTIECLAKWDTTSDLGGILVESSPACYMNPGSFRINYTTGTGGSKTVEAAFRASAWANVEYRTTVEDFGELNDNKWRHYALVYDPSKRGKERAAFYVDGVAVTNQIGLDTGTNPFALLDTNLFFTRRSNIAADTLGSVPFYGSLDDVRITAGVLKPEQFLAGRSSGSTVALYCFDKETLEDQTGNGHELVNEGNAAFGTGTHAASGTGLVLNGTDQWLHLKDALDLSHTKGMTVEFDCYDDGPHVNGSGENYQFWVYAATDDPSVKGGFTVYRNGQGNSMQAQFRVVSNTTWDISYANSTLPSLQKGRFQIDTTANPQSQIYLNGITGTRAQDNSRAFDNLGSKMLCFGHSPNYAAQGFLKGKYRRIAISDVALAQGDFVLDNLLDPEEKRTLAYWTFAGFDDKAGASGNDLLVVNASRRNGALLLGGQTSYAETSADLDLSTLSQVTVECFVLFGETPSGGTLFGLGEGAGSFAVSGDAVAGKLSGAFQPYQASYSYQQVVTDPETSTETTNTLTATVGASNGGVTELAPLAGVKAWHHVALVIDRTATERDAVRLYVDYERAELAGRAWDSATRLLDGKLVIGASAAYDNFFAGCIDDVRVSAGALEPSEFLQPNQRTEAQDGMIVSIR